MNANNNSDADTFLKRLQEAVKGNFPGTEFGADNGKGIPPFLKNETPYSVASASNIPTEKSEKFVSQTIEKLLDGIVPGKSKEEYTLILLASPINDIEQRKLRLSQIYSGLKPYSSWQTNFTVTELNTQGSSATVGVNVGASAGIQNGQNSSTTNSNAVSNNESQTNTDSTSNGTADTTSDTTSNTTSEANAHTDNQSTSDMTSDSTSHTDNQSTSDMTSENTSHTDNTNESTNQGGNVNISPSISILGSGGSLGGGGASWGSSSGTGTADTLAKGTAKTLMNGTADTATQTTAQTLMKGAADTLTKSTAKTLANTVAKTTSSQVGHAVAKTLGKTVTDTLSKTAGVFSSTNFGVNFGMNFARSSNVSASIGKNEGIVQSFENYNIQHALELLEEQMKRLEQSTALGMWDFAAYVLSEDRNVANNVAHTYLSLTQGETSYMSSSAVNLWRGDQESSDVYAKTICSYLRELRHPVFGLNPFIVDTDEGRDYQVYPTAITATTSLSGKELAYSLNFPQKSVAGLPVIQCADFGRSIATFDTIVPDERSISLGKIFHMHHEEKLPVELSANSLASHTFITGSTGFGKSNTVYQILSEAIEKDIHFLVIEPAKGEYKDVFNNYDNISVYGTNPRKTPLLRINPFSFPNDVHVLEHIDRLVEIFNVCWPMYAAMPAVLKNAVEKSYKDCGWDLMSSVNKYDDNLYPSFADVARNIKEIIDTSEYDKENKGAYKGSLLTRLQSLTTGINGLIFSSDELSGQELFDSNVIIDLSRVGASETKSLIMGMLVFKLQEYRMSGGSDMNSALRHITVLEEAHNILRRTSIEQPSESSNIMGKSVEMISNAIAEMRTYGEGFIIADQSPGLMDMSVIRNTNTKIIMRLPDRGDRELVGKAANLNDDQIDELAKLPCGVAAVYQNEWIQPVLCKVKYYETSEKPYTFDTSDNSALIKKNDELSDSLLKCIMDNELFQRGDKQDLRELKSLILRSTLDSIVKVDFLDYLATEREKGFSELQCLIYDFLKAEDAIQSATKYDDIHEWVDAVITELKPSISNFSKKQIDLTMALILHEKTIRDPSYRNIYHTFTEVYKNGGGVF
ncbi:MAG: helicase HerA domain-containing protein [Ruminococcus sp.]